MKVAKHFSLIQEHPQSFEIHDARDNRKFHVVKGGIDAATAKQIQSIPKFSDGTVDGPVSSSMNDSPDQIVAEANRSPASSIPGGPSEAPVSASFDPTPTELSQAKDARAQAENARWGILPAPSGPAPASVPAAASAPPPQSNAPDPAMGAFANMQNTSNKALWAEEQSLLGGATAETKAGEKKAAAYGAYAEKLDQMLTPEQIYKNYQETDDKMRGAYARSEIDSKRLWHNASTGQKIATGIGLIFGGMGAAMTGGPNYAHDSIQKAIDRDIESQKLDQSKSFNLWKMNHEALKDNMEATLATKNQMLAAVEAKAMQFTSEAAGPEARARIAPLVAQIQQQMNMNNFKRSLLKSSNNPNNPGGKLQVDPSLFLDQVPEHQRAEAAKEIATAQKMKSLSESVEQNVLDLKSKFMNGLLSPHDRSSAIDSFASQMDTLSDHRFNLEASRLKGDAFFPAPGDTKDTVEHKDRRREEFFRDQMQAPVFHGATFIPLDRFKSTSITPRAPGAQGGAPQTATRNGVLYQKVPGGWVPVKK